MKAFWIPVALLLLGVGLLLGPDTSALPTSWPDLSNWSSWFGKTSPVDRVIVIYESLNQPADQVSVMGGITSQAIRKVDKWRQWDKDLIPDSLKAALTPIVKKYGVPCICLMRKDTIFAPGKLPNSDPALSAYITKNGGF